MKEYFFLKGKDQKGPYTIEQLAGSLTNETLIWTEGMENWQKLKDIPELVQILKPKSIPPPPPPIEGDEKISMTELSGELKIISEKHSKYSPKEKKLLKRALIILILWLAFHSLILFLLFADIPYVNNAYDCEKSFWPFVQFFNEYNDNFYGWFACYDGVEFIIYTGLAIVIYIILRVSKSK
jgi:hypothetical protein